MKICLIDTLSDVYRLEFASEELYTILQCLQTGIVSDEFKLRLFNIRENLLDRITDIIS